MFKINKNINTNLDEDILMSDTLTVSQKWYRKTFSIVVNSQIRLNNSKFVCTQNIALKWLNRQIYNYVVMVTTHLSMNTLVYLGHYKNMPYIEMDYKQQICISYGPKYWEAQD